MIMLMEGLIYKMFNKKNILKWVPKDNSLTDVVPAKKHIPDWYKSIKGYNYNNLEFRENNIKYVNVKSCMPFFDSLTSGYMIELWCDLHFEIVGDKGEHIIRWNEEDFHTIEVRDSNENPIPIPIGCEPTHYVWRFPYCLEVPQGYSLLISHPFNRFDLPFITLTGIVDADSVMAMGNLPFFVKKDFSGVLHRGTPIAQVIPIKRENWLSEKDDDLLLKGELVRKKANHVYFGEYKNNRWKRKKYE